MCVWNSALFEDVNLFKKIIIVNTNELCKIICLSQRKKARAHFVSTQNKTIFITMTKNMYNAAIPDPCNQISQSIIFSSDFANKVYLRTLLYLHAMK